MPPILIAKGADDLFLLPEMANRHGLIAGATGTGKTVTLQVLAENFSDLGVPVFMADIKGDLTGISQSGGQNPKVATRIQELKLPAYEFRDAQSRFGTSLENKATPLGRRFRKWGRCSFRGFYS